MAWLPAAPTRQASNPLRQRPVLVPALLLVTVAGLALCRPGQAAAFRPGNLLVTEGNILYEYRRDGTRVQSVPIPHPDTSRYDATDVAVDDGGLAHVVVSAPFDFDYLGTYDPVGRSWSFHRITATLGNVSDGDLGLMGDFAYTKHQEISLIDFTTRDIVLPGTAVGEIAVGGDGLLYALDSGSPRPGVRVLDPVTLGVLRSFTLLDAFGTRRDARGIAVTPGGEMYVADWDGNIYHYDTAGSYLRQHSTGVSNLLNLDLHADGTMVLGTRFGEVVQFDASFATFPAFRVGDGLTYVAFVPGTALPSALLRNDEVTTLAPLQPPLATIFPLDPLNPPPAGDRYQSGFSSGDLDLDTAVLGDPSRPLVFYGLDPPADLLLVKAAGRVRIFEAP